MPAHMLGSAATLCNGQGQHATPAPAVATCKHVGSRHWCVLMFVRVKYLNVEACTMMFLPEIHIT